MAQAAEKALLPACNKEKARQTRTWDFSWTHHEMRLLSNKLILNMGVSSQDIKNRKKLFLLGEMPLCVI